MSQELQAALAAEYKKRIAILGSRIKAVDHHLIHLLARRISISKEVAMVKLEAGERLYNPERETDRLAAVAEWGSEQGLNPDFVRAILYLIIDESCKQQIALTDTLRIDGTYEKFVPSLDDLHANLLRLTEAYAPMYESSYGKLHPATRALITFEREQVAAAIKKLPHKHSMLDLGCATGREMRLLAEEFDDLQGFDLSGHMVEEGRKLAQAEGLHHVKLDVHDIEQKLPVADSSVSFVLMNGGTGSDVPDISAVFNEIQRVLVPGGRFVASFYNKEAWTQRIFFPWRLGTVAGVDRDRGCLEVFCDGKLVPVYAKPYTFEEVKALLPEGLSISKDYRYPTLLSVLPEEVMENGCAKMLENIDRGLSEERDVSLGSYLIISGKKA